MHAFQLGMIEGFYGRDWSDSDRLSTLPWLKSAGFQSYLYAPKSDASLRSQWQTPFSSNQRQRLSDIAAAAASTGLAWGVGFSPLGAVYCFGRDEQGQLREKISALAELKPDLIAILFDDMRCEHDDLAQRQCEIVRHIAAQLPDSELFVCPSYYSFDPVLEKVFGDRPQDYWQQLGSELPQSAEIFWTGNQVCSASLLAEDLTEITERLGRAPALWDNYPVNDGERASQFLHLKSFENRDPKLQTFASAHFCNPMNQCYLSRLALASLPKVYQQAQHYDPHREFLSACESLLPPELATAVVEDISEFTELGLQNISTARRATLIKKYSCFSHPAASEISDWLNGVYRFDPACLTEAVP